MAVKMRPARMSSAEYWRRRESERRKERIADEKERAKLLQEIYRSAVDQMTREIESFYQRYARDEQITLADARRRVSMLDMKEYERLAKQYVAAKDFSPEANRQMKLYNLTMKANRLELLRNRLGLEMVKMTNDTQTEISRALVERSLETFEEYAGILGESVRDPLALAATISQEPFKGAKWSERLWGTNQKGLYDSVSKTIENALISGKNARQLASSLQKQYGRSLYEAQRLMVTEMARCQTEAAKLSMEVNGNEYYMVLTANAMGPCGDCSDLEDQTTRDPIPVKDMEPGVNAPPLHPSCHCATAPWWDEGKYQEWLNSGAARDGGIFEQFETEKTAEEKELLHTSYPNTVQTRALDAPGFVEKFSGITGIEQVDMAIYESAKEILTHRNGTNFEDLYLIDAETGDIIHKLTSCDILHGVDYDDATKKALDKAKQDGRVVLSIHNHPGGLPPSLDDGVSAYDHDYVKGIAVGHNLEVYVYGKTDLHYNSEQCKAIHESIKEAVQFSIEFDDSIWYNTLRLFGMEVSRK